MMNHRLLLGLPVLLSLSVSAPAQYDGWKHSGALWIVTTPDGADLPASCAERDFPLLVRLRGESFPFDQAMPHGEDIRFSDAAGRPLAYQIEQWDAAARSASIWVKISSIQGNARQEIKLYWGKPDAKSESSGPAVFGSGSGFCTVMHLGDDLVDETGTITPKDKGTTPAAGIIGPARHFTPGKGINGGDAITTFPYGDMPFTSEVWVRPEAAGKHVFHWGRYATRLNGRTGDGNEVGISLDSPARFGWGSDGPGGVRAEGEPPTLGQWHHVAATYSDGTSRIYVDGKLAGSNFHRAAMSIARNINMTVGGIRGHLDFAGDIDEVRVSRVARSADWIKLQYENQKPFQTLIGSLVQPGDALAVSPAELTIPEGQTAEVTAQAGGAQKVYWLLARDGREEVVAVDQLRYTLEAGRVTADLPRVLKFKAVYADGVKTKEIPVTIKEDIPEPQVTLRGPSAWNGRDTIEVTANIANLAAMQAKGAGQLHYAWSVAGGAVIKQTADGKLTLKRSQYTGPIMVKALVDNSGAPTVATLPIQVTEPKSDPWVERVPDKDEKPEDNQFYARDDKNYGTLYYSGTLDKPADSVFLKVYADDKLQQTWSLKLKGDNAYLLPARLEARLVKYKVEFGAKRGNVETVLHTANNLVCGDAYIIEGQSNAEATGPNNGPMEDPVTPINDWIRSYGNQLEGSIRGGWASAVRTHIWGRPNYGCHQIGAWGMVLAENLVKKYRVPICIINGAYGGTPIYLHQRNPANRFDTSGGFYANPYKIYGSLLTRVTAARLTHGIRGVFWHQGENDSGAGAPTGDWNYKSYQQYFVDMAAAWKEDFPNIRHYYVFQVWPLPCAMGPTDDQLREAQRTLPRLFSNLRVMSTLGIVSKATGRGMCHYDLDGYAGMARLLSPLVEQDNYGLVPQQPVTAPDLREARFTSAARDELALEFSQPLVWTDSAKVSFYLDGARAAIAEGKTSGNTLLLKLKEPSAAKTISYVKGRDWDGTPKTLIYGSNGIAALTFCEVPISGPAADPARPAAIHFEPTIESLKQYVVPEWFEDAKLGIYMHWGPQSVPGVATTWYARWMYEQGSEGYKYHVATYGHPSKFGYKDVCKLFQAAKFDQAQADRLAALYKRAGARYLVPVAVHHDNFDMWDSKHQPRWNSVAICGKDIVGMWKKAADAQGLRLGVASHVARTYRWLQPSHGADRSGPLAGVPYDGQDPRFADLYGVKWHSNSFWYEQMSDAGPPEFEKQFEDRMKDLLDKYQPDLYYTDGGIPFARAGLNVLAHFYNESRKAHGGRLEAVATIKLDWVPNIAVPNYEYGFPAVVQKYPWQTDKTVGADWYWLRNRRKDYKSAAQVVAMLIDAVSRNGALLLNVPLTPDGELEPEPVTMLEELGRCLDVIGEAVFATRPWEIADDGQGPGDARFTRNKAGTALYATTLAWPGDALRIRVLNAARIDLTGLREVSLLGSPGKLAFRQDAEGLTIQLPSKPPQAGLAYAFKLTFAGPIPRLKDAPPPGLPPKEMRLTRP